MRYKWIIGIGLLLGLSLGTVHGSARTYRALIVAIAKYPAHSGWASLHADRDKELLCGCFRKYAFEDIRVCADEAATYQRITTELDGLVRRAEPGDRVWIHFSCHGQQMEDLNGDEPDGLDEALVPYDARMYYEPGVYEGECHLRDDELNEYLTAIRKRLGEAGEVWVSLDACHSASATRGDESSGRRIRGTCLIFSANPGFQPPDMPGNGYVDVPLRSEAGWAPLTVLSACQSYQDNWECEVDGRGYGVLSYAIARAFADYAGWPENDERFLREIDKLVRRLSPWQTPVIESTKRAMEWD